MSGTVTVWSDLSIRIETGLRRGDFEGGSGLSPGPNYKSAQLRLGVQDVDGQLIREWLKTNRKYLDCIKDGRVRILDSVSRTVTEETAA